MPTCLEYTVELSISAIAPQIVAFSFAVVPSVDDYSASSTRMNNLFTLKARFFSLRFLSYFQSLPFPFELLANAIKMTGNRSSVGPKLLQQEKYLWVYQGRDYRVTAP
jgi:hypothetical protein